MSGEYMATGVDVILKVAVNMSIEETIREHVVRTGALLRSGREARRECYNEVNCPPWRHQDSKKLMSSGTLEDTFAFKDKGVQTHIQ